MCKHYLKLFDTARKLCIMAANESELSAKFKSIRGELSAEQVAAKANLSRESVYRIERGVSVKLETLRQIALALKLTEADWLELLSAWIRSELGLEASKLWIEPRDSSVSKLKEAGEDQVAMAMVYFRQLNSRDRDEVLKAMQRPEVRACLHSINRVWEKFDVR